MKIATTSSAFDLLPKDQKYKTKRVSYNDFSDLSFLPVVNPKIKRQKKTLEEEVDSTSKAKSSRTSLTKSVTTTTKLTKPEETITASSKECLQETKTNKKPDLRDLIAKAQEKIQNKREINHRREYITRQRIAARLALNQMVATVSFDDHLNYHREMEQRGYTFIQDQVDNLNMFSLWSRSDYNGITNSVLETSNTTMRSDEDSSRKKQQIIKKKSNTFPTDVKEH
ncbi:hypothetical protein AtNW77_Chr1g0032581 [Arabidopsis thaliana]|uniref:Uncharacterized protein F15D2.6 n=3 Tax=Arabidopsis TaxID=3701 RepID=Q9C7Q3_ARATH|nr:uncharacterized protein AT1G29480 [Arabidopsis thaliana]KAG7647931.1 hypothetical protein ISN45_At01g029210 [Arabidopsis thaliana x Arabidopsis arenosa]AAG51755.1 hypothetical protein; 60363-61138 [Arabidopsis thaliana]AEE31095.1 hypothetical protein AT1G29480 [Arabidopsis thaliana]OAP15903.1 hypothetical protein AXX17_AT1G29880 [Arabidopsis thaliana]CAA0253965.1 unnamed protein product [Arabidopsis thaliana]|eukprot:NP_174241.1 hypothetical protein AT1G29480 [Arabidopsis thaliana]